MITEETKHIYAGLLLSALVCMLIFGGSATAVYVMHKHANKPTVAHPTFPGVFSINPDSLTAHAALLYDPTNGEILFAKNASTSLPLASITKLMTAEVVLSNGAVDNKMHRITIEDIAPEGDSGLRPGDVFSVVDLLKLGLVASSNDAMAAAAASIGTDPVALMNQEAHVLSLFQTRFFNTTGLDVDTETSGAYSSAYDVARLAAYFYRTYPHYFELTTKPSVSVKTDGRTISAVATDAPLLSIPQLVGAKTGYTDLAGGNLVAIFDVEIGHPLVAVVLDSTENGRFVDMRTLIDAAVR